MRPQDELIRSMARRVVAEVAPAELPLFEDGAAAFLAAPRPLSAVARPRDEALGFGAAGAVAFLTPIALAIVKEVLEQVTAVARQEVGGGAAGAVRRALRWLLRALHLDAPAPPAAVPALSVDQLSLVRARIHARALDAGVPEEQARLMADAVVGQLAVSQAA